MKNRGHKIKFRGGKDANKMLMRKLVSNFLHHGRMVTTKHKAKAAQSEVEKLVTKAKTATKADRNEILKRVTHESIIDILFRDITPALSKVKSGFTRIVLLGKRKTDAAEIARLEWAYPVILKKEEKSKPSVIKEKTEKTEVKSVDNKTEPTS